MTHWNRKKRKSKGKWTKLCKNKKEYQKSKCLSYLNKNLICRAKEDIKDSFR